MSDIHQESMEAPISVEKLADYADINNPVASPENRRRAAQLLVDILIPAYDPNKSHHDKTITPRCAPLLSGYGRKIPGNQYPEK